MAVMCSEVRHVCRPSFSSSVPMRLCGSTRPNIAYSVSLITRPVAQPRSVSHRNKLARPYASASPSGSDGGPSSNSQRQQQAEQIPATSPAQPVQQALNEPRMPFSLITTLAGLGALETAYLTLSKFTDTPVACPTSGPISGCQSVLESEWSKLFGVIPMSLLGMLTYGAVAAAAAIGGRRQAAGLEEREDSVTSALRSAVLGGGIALGTCSAFFMYILFTQFPGELCPWCLGSAILSVGVLAAALSGHSSSELGRSATPASSLMATLAIVLTVNFSVIQQSQAGIEIPYQEPPVSTESSEQAASLAKRLKDAGARMYGAFWCSHCFDQKEAFGRQAMANFPYVECYPGGYRQGVEIAAACSEANIKGFPTWAIGETRLEGEQSFEVLETELAKLLQTQQQQQQQQQQLLQQAPPLAD